MALPATSGTYVSQPTIYRIIRAALRRLRVISEDETPSASQMQTAMETANDLVKNWQASGIHVWAQVDATLWLNTEQSQYIIGAGCQGADPCAITMGIAWFTLASAAGVGATSLTLATMGGAGGPSSVSGIGAGAAIGILAPSGQNFWTTAATAGSGSTVALTSALTEAIPTGTLVWSYAQNQALVRPLRIPAAQRMALLGQFNRTPLIRMARIDYANIPNPLNTGTVTQYFYDPSRVPPTQPTATVPGGGVMNLWPSPSDNFSALSFTAQRPLQDWDNVAEVPDFPQEWNRAITWGLAQELGPEYGAPGTKTWTEVVRLAGESLALAQAWDREPEPIYFGLSDLPFSRP